MPPRGTVARRRAARGLPLPARPGTIVVRGTPSPADPSAQLPCDSYGQTVSALRGIADALARAGATLHDVVSTRISVADPAALLTAGRAHTAFFRGIGPAVTMVDTVTRLDSRLIVEIEAHAIPGGTARKTECERCGTGITGDPGAANCGWNCTFCSACSRALDSCCPNCGGALVARRAAAG